MCESACMGVKGGMGGSGGRFDWTGRLGGRWGGVRMDGIAADGCDWSCLRKALNLIM